MITIKIFELLLWVGFVCALGGGIAITLLASSAYWIRISFAAIFPSIIFFIFLLLGLDKSISPASYVHTFYSLLSLAYLGIIFLVTMWASIGITKLLSLLR